MHLFTRLFNVFFSLRQPQRPSPSDESVCLPAAPEQKGYIEFSFSEGDVVSIMFALHHAGHFAADCFREGLSLRMQQYLEDIGAWDNPAIERDITSRLLIRDNPPSVPSTAAPANPRPRAYTVSRSGGEPAINIAVCEGSGSLESFLPREDENTVGDREYNAAIDGIESLVLALACAGVNVQTAAFTHALETAMDAAGNTFDDDTPLPKDAQERAV